jgi:anaerobic ribonucleoside-triphosphate reductase activating protein
MTNTMVHHVAVEYDPLLSVTEMTAIVEEEITLWKERRKELARVELAIDGENIVIKAIEKSPVRRVRRITGYLSNMENFNDAKQDELQARYKHCCG